MLNKFMEAAHPPKRTDTNGIHLHLQTLTLTLTLTYIAALTHRRYRGWVALALPD